MPLWAAVLAIPLFAGLFRVAHWWDSKIEDRDGIHEHLKKKITERPARRPSERRKFERLKEWVRQQREGK